ncbi:VOC family protein [Thalassococcus sp. CAU 1522]|uniref:VOC family protein n=1 Tax=Thalassococcus arenae TaxID=2851652 RepID=A0ABS6NB20_9RHOB|nr:VOC family protein [Thalassococcus arenae]MBV2361226.1 VOC family protein [Thalassococcus arenae]
MSVSRIDHVNLRTNQLRAMVDWYGAVLGLTPGARPDFGFPGAWLYAGEQALVHLVEVHSEATGSEVDLKLEHFALTATGLSDFQAMLDQRGIKYRRSAVPGTEIVQINIWDPDGNHIHVDFTGEA